MPKPADAEDSNAAWRLGMSIVAVTHQVAEVEPALTASSSSLEVAACAAALAAVLMEL